jgi:uncharacterized membrane protein YphA (DoxX/SURF4 family)
MIRISCWAAIFLIFLRVLIGWHFAFEGLSKVKSAYTGTAVVNEKPFSSEAFFRESETPVGRFAKKYLGDSDLLLIEQLTPKTEGAKAADQFPSALATEWDDYYQRFTAAYPLTDDQKKEAEANFETAKANFVHWLKGKGEIIDKEKDKRKELKITVKRPAVGSSPTAEFEEDILLSQRVAELKQKKEEARLFYDKMWELKKDVDGTRLRAVKTETAAIRTQLKKELDDQTKKMKDGLASVFGTAITAFPVKAPDAASINSFLVPMADGKNPLSKLWDDYATYVKEKTGASEASKAEIDLKLKQAKERFDRWLKDEDPQTGKPLTSGKPFSEWKQAFEATLAKEAEAKKNAAKEPEKKDAPKKEPEKKEPEKKDPKEPAKKDAVVKEEPYKPDPKAIAADLTGQVKYLLDRGVAELKQQTDAMRTQVGDSLGDDRSKGYAPPDESKWIGLFPKIWKPIDFVDWSTRWFLLVVGALLMVGLFTRLSCFAASIFLLLTILVQPAVPWLPTPPNVEGNYFFVNKNMIEMMALLVLMTTRTGRWVGLDGLLGWIFGGKKKAPKETQQRSGFRLQPPPSAR